jgi:hypothetical protein
MSRSEGRPSFGAPLLGRDVTVDGGVAALLAAIAGSLLVGLAGGPVGAMVAGVASAIVTVVGLIRVSDADPLSRAVGSIALVAGAVFFTRAAVLPDTALGLLAVVCGSLAVLSVAVETLLGERAPPLRPAMYALFGSTGIMLLAGGIILLAGVLSPVGAAPTTLLVVALADLASPSPSIPGVLLSLVFLQVLVICLSLVVDRATTVLERWVPPEQTGGFDILDRLGVEASEIPRTVWAFLGAQLFLALLLPGVLDGILAATLPGEVLYTLLTSGLVHLPVVVLLVVFSVVVAVEPIRGLLMRLGGYHPPTMIGLVAGGLLVTAVALVGGALSVVGLNVPGGLASVVPGSGVFWPGAGPYWHDGSALSLWSIAGRTAVFTLLVGGGGWVVHNTVEKRIPGVSVGAVLLFAAAVLGSEAGAHPVAVFVTVGLALGALEAGSRSSRLSRRLGPSVDTRSAELVHLLGSAVAITVGIVLATAALYLVVPAAVGLGDARAVMLLVAGLAGLFAAIIVFGWGSSSPAG